MPNTPTFSTTSGLGIPLHDTEEMTYDGDNVSQVVYKLGGRVVATLTMTYAAGKLTKVERT